MAVVRSGRVPLSGRLGMALAKGVQQYCSLYVTSMFSLVSLVMHAAKSPLLLAWPQTAIVADIVMSVVHMITVQLVIISLFLPWVTELKDLSTAVDQQLLFTTAETVGGARRSFLLTCKGRYVLQRIAGGDNTLMWILWGVMVVLVSAAAADLYGDMHIAMSILLHVTYTCCVVLLDHDTRKNLEARDRLTNLQSVISNGLATGALDVEDHVVLDDVDNLEGLVLRVASYISSQTAPAKRTAAWLVGGLVLPVRSTLGWVSSVWSSLLCWCCTAAASACKQVAAASSLVRRYIPGCASRLGYILGLLHLFTMPYQYLYITWWLHVLIATELMLFLHPLLACTVGVLQLLLLPGTRGVLRQPIEMPGRMHTWLFQARARRMRPQYEPTIRVGTRTSWSRPVAQHRSVARCADPLVQERVWAGGMARCWLLLAANHFLWIASSYHRVSCTAHPCGDTLPMEFYEIMFICHLVFACLWLGMAAGPSEAVGSPVLKYFQRLVTLLFCGHWGAPCSIPPTGTVAGAVFSTLSHLLFWWGPANVAFALWQQAELPVTAADVRGVFFYVSRALSGSSWVVADCIAALMVMVVLSVLTGWRFWGQLIAAPFGAATAVLLSLSSVSLQLTRGIQASVTRSVVQLQLLLGWLKSAIASVRRRYTTPRASQPVPCRTPAGAQPRSRIGRLKSSFASVLRQLLMSRGSRPVHEASGMHAGLRLWLLPARLKCWFAFVMQQLIRPCTWWHVFRSSKSSTSNCAGSSTAAEGPAGDSSSSGGAHPTEPVTARAEALTAAAQEAMRECVICQDAARSVALKPCGHLACCEACFARLQRDAVRCSSSRRSGPGRLKCPVCRADVQGHVAGIIL